MTALGEDPSNLFSYAVVLLFVMTVVLIYVLAGAVLLRAVIRRLGRTPKPSILDHALLRRTCLALAAAGTLCIAYGRWIEPFRIEVSHVRIPSAKLKPGDSLRILHISDTHCDGWGPNEARLLEIAREEYPDLIVFTGDSCNNPGPGAAAFRRLVGSLQASSGCYAVRGNWDVWFWNLIDLFGDTGWRELDGHVTTDVRGTPVAVCGAPYGGDYRSALAGLPPEAFTLFLYHTPDLVREPELQTADLYCAGHTHGGQVCLPGWGALVTFSRYGKAYESGLYGVGKCALYVCRGLGMEGGAAPRVRFWCRPEAALIEVVPLH